MTEVAIATVSWRAIQSEHFTSLFEFLTTKPKDGHDMVHIKQIGDALVDRARAIAATKFLRETTADVLLSVDDDIIFKAKDAWQIIEQAEEYNIVSGMYVTRGRGEGCKPASILDYGQTVEFGTDPEPIPIRWPAGGFLAVHRRVLEDLARRLPLCHANTDWPFYPFYQPFWVDDEESGQTIYLSEDYALAQRALEAGYPSYLNPAVRLRHIGVAYYRLEDVAVPEPPSMTTVIRRNENGSYTVRRPDEWHPAHWEEAKPSPLILVK